MPSAVFAGPKFFFSSPLGGQQREALCGGRGSSLSWGYIFSYRVYELYIYLIGLLVIFIFSSCQLDNLRAEDAMPAEEAVNGAPR